MTDIYYRGLQELTFLDFYPLSSIPLKSLVPAHQPSRIAGRDLYNVYISVLHIP